MNELKTEYKFKVGEIVHFMHENKIRIGVIDNIRITCKSRTLRDGTITTKIANGLLNVIGCENLK